MIGSVVEPLPPQLLVPLGGTVAVGDLEVTPQKVERKRIAYLIGNTREPATEALTPVNLPGSPEMPASPAAAGAAPGRYQLLGEIARGGMGSVLRGHDPELGSELAVKVILPEHRDNPNLLRRFVGEARLSGQLQHPGIMPVYDLGQTDDGRPFFARARLVAVRNIADLEQLFLARGQIPVNSDLHAMTPFSRGETALRQGCKAGATICG